MPPSSLAPLALLLSLPACNALSGINDYETADPLVSPAVLAPDAAGEAGPDTPPDTDAAELRVDAEPDGGGEAEAEVAPDAPADTAPPDSGAPDAPDAAPSCTHSNGLGDSYTLCVPLGVPGTATYTKEMAAAASDAWAPFKAPMEGWCAGVAGNFYARCRSATDCAIWMRSGPSAGRVRRIDHSAIFEPDCPGVGDPVWN